MNPTEDQINSQIGLAIDNNGRYPGMTYEEGVRDTLLWVTGDREDPPMEEE